MSCLGALFSTLVTTLKLKNHDLDVLTEMGLECLYLKEILEVW